ncbi:unnamed protein product [Cuscuta europaea]|uniref:Proline-rich protein n=1 Tax=Cuscuta europaea TaxID=41803 RepID=A0A9P0YHW9_CUSEU|nr:unnamed protein product [Cuscuta europaea]
MGLLKSPSSGVFLLSLILVQGLCYAADDATIQVIGFGECADCKENNILSSHAFSELRVRIDCKLQNGKMATRSESGVLDEDGKFKVSLPKEIVKDGKEECYAQLHDASAASPCPAHEGIEASKIVARTNPDGHQVFEPAGKVRFSSALCTSAFLPLDKKPFLNKPFFKKPFFKKPLLPYTPPFPFYKPKPSTPIVHTPSVPVYKPKPKPTIHTPSVPIYKPKPKPTIHTPSVPIYKPIPKPTFHIPSVPIYKPIPKPTFHIPSVPIYKPKPKPLPIYYKPPFKPLLPPSPFYKLKPKPSVHIPPFSPPWPHLG